MRIYRVEIIHPTPGAAFYLSVQATSANHAKALAYRRINDKYPGTLYLIGDIYPE